MKDTSITINEKYLLTIKEASTLFSIGEMKLRQVVRENPSADFVLMNGSKYLIKRKQFESLLDSTDAI